MNTDSAARTLGAALVTAMLTFAGCARAVTPQTDDATITTRVKTALLNDRMQRPGVSARYATLFFGLLYGRQRTLRYTNCGHVPPLHLGRDGVRKLDAGGRPLGLFEGGCWEDGTCRLEEGDVVALFTDGIVETTDPRGLEFGEARLAEVLVAHAGRPLQDVVTAVLEAREAWSGHARPHDDVTLVLARAGSAGREA